MEPIIPGLAHPVPPKLIEYVVPEVKIVPVLNAPGQYVPAEPPYG